jgi:beta-glucanase (GH16 family)
MDFIKQSLPTMEYEFVDMSTNKMEKLPSLNGFWQTGFNFGFGYGLNNVFCDESDDYHGDREDEEGEEE